MDTHLLHVAMGKQKADLVVRNGQIINVCTGEIYSGGVAVAGNHSIVAVGVIVGVANTSISVAIGET